MFPSLRSFGVLAILLIGSNCQAGTITAELAGASNNGAPVVRINDGNGSSKLTSYDYAGYLNWTQKPGLNNVSLPLNFTSFCIELTQQVGFGDKYTFQTETLELAPGPGSPQS